jgi:hypothetical protein
LRKGLDGTEEEGREAHILSTNDRFDDPVAFELDDGGLRHILIVIRPAEVSGRLL